MMSKMFIRKVKDSCFHFVDKRETTQIVVVFQRWEFRSDVITCVGVERGHWKAREIVETCSQALGPSPHTWKKKRDSGTTSVWTLSMTLTNIVDLKKKKKNCQTWKRKILWCQSSVSDKTKTNTLVEHKQQSKRKEDVEWPASWSWDSADGIIITEERRCMSL